jgi:hypothetical protein
MRAGWGRSLAIKSQWENTVDGVRQNHHPVKSVNAGRCCQEMTRVVLR